MLGLTKTMSIIIGSASELSLDQKEICLFYENNWERKIALSNVDFYNWQFIDNPNNTSNDSCCVALDGDQIIGVMGLNERDFYLSGKQRKGAELTTWVVSQNKRNSGIGPKMISYLKENYEIMIGMGISQAALPIYLRSGFRYIKAIPRYVHPINWDRLAPFIKSSPLAKKYSREHKLKKDFIIQEANEEVVNNIFSKFNTSSNSFSRYWKDIKWRYDKHPYFDYSYFIVNNSCFVAIRIDRQIDGFTMAHCVDIFGDKDQYQSAITAAISFAVDNNADAIDFFSTQSSLCSTLNEMGLFSTLDHDFFVFPHLFHPVEIRNPATTSLILWSKDDFSNMLDMGKLHITKQDVDLDRPTAQVINK